MVLDVAYMNVICMYANVSHDGGMCDSEVSTWLPRLHGLRGARFRARSHTFAWTGMLHTAVDHLNGP